MNALIEQLEKLNEEEVAQLYKNLFTSPDGQLVLEDLKGRCYVYSTTFAPIPYTTYWQEGMRNVILHIESQINYVGPVANNGAD
jgi:hypothetical protein